MADNHSKHLQMDLEPFLISLTVQLISAAPEEIDSLIEKSLGTICDWTQTDRCYIYLFDEKKQSATLSYHYEKPGIKAKIPYHDRIDSDDFSWLIQPILNKGVIRVSSATDLPLSAGTIRAIMQVEKTCSFLLCPLIFHQNGLGFIGLDTVDKEKTFTREIEFYLNLSGSLFAAAITRKNQQMSGDLLEQKFRTLFTSIEDVIFMTTPEGRFLEINPAGAKLFGFQSVNELINVDISRDLFYNPQDRLKYQQLLSEKGQVKDYELLLRDNNGKKLLVSVTASAVRNGKGDIIAYQGILRDITYKRQLEQELFQAKKMESIGMLAGGIAHDFNNILTIINGFAELVLMEMDTSDKHYDNIENIMKGVRRAEDLIKQLLAFSRKQMIEPEIVDLSKSITELNSMLKRLISEDIKFEVSLKKDLSFIKADPVQIQQILVNLIVNAGQAIKRLKRDGGLKLIRIVTDEKTVNRELTLKYPGIREGKYVTIAIQDTGVGMDEEVKKNIFEPFFSTSKGNRGTGLGLSTVYGIVKQNNGFIYVESQPEKGSIFQIFWPATAEKKRPETKVESYIQIQPHSETLLFVEDDDNLRSLMSGALRKFGYEIIEAENGGIAMELVRKQNLISKLDLVITDMVMPEMGGEALATELRKLRPDIKILLCSGFTDSRITMKKEQGQDPYPFISKPYRINKLEKTIRRILNSTKES